MEVNSDDDFMVAENLKDLSKQVKNKPACEIAEILEK